MEGPFSDTLLIIFGGFTALKTSGLFKNQKNQICPYKYNNNHIIMIIILPKINLENLELLRPWGPQTKLPGIEAPCLHDTNLNTLSTQTPRNQELLGHIKKEWQIKMMCF